VRAPEDRTREGARRLDHEAAEGGLTAFESEFTSPPSLIVIDCSAQAGVDPLASFALEPAAPQVASQAERANEPQRLVRTRRRNVGQRRATQAAGLVLLAAVASFALMVLRSPDQAVAPRPVATLAQVEQRTVPPPPVPEQQELDVPRAAAITGTTQSTPQTADELSRVPNPVPPPQVQAAKPPLAAGRPAPREIVPQPSIVPTPVRPAAPVDADSPRTPVSSPVAAVGRDAAPSASLPVPTAGATPPEPSVARTAEAPPPPAPPASATPPAAARGGAQRAAVEAVLGQYASAFSALDARRAKAVWPTVNEKNLERAFDSLEQQEFDLGACDITVLAPRALALCDGTARYTPRVGNRKARTESRRWSFTLLQTGQGWAIESVNLR